MSKFGYSEVIHVDSQGKATAVKTSQSFGVDTLSTYKEAESIRIENDKDAISEFLSAIQRIKTKEMRYLCFEVYTSEKDGDFLRVNVCHIRDEPIVK